MVSYRSYLLFNLVLRAPLTGDVIHLDILGQSIIVLNSQEAATDLLDKRSAKYSDRPSFPIFHLWVPR